MAALLPLILHERRNTWARQVRPRMVDWPIRVVETRSTVELTDTCARSACPILVVDLGDRPTVGLADLEQATRIAPNGLSLVIDPGGHREVALIARELGAIHTLSGRVAPPKVLRLLQRWVLVAARRVELDGWADEYKPDLEPWETLLAEELKPQGDGQ